MANEKQFVRRFVDDIRQTVATMGTVPARASRVISDAPQDDADIVRISSAQNAAEAGLQLASCLAG